MSSRRGSDDKDKLGRLDDLVIAEVAAAPDDEVLKVVGKEEIAHTRAAFATAKGLVGKSRMAQAKASVAILRARPLPGVGNRPRGGAALRALRAQDTNLDNKLTMAARSGGASVEADEASIEEDLAELESLEAETKGGNE
jgi:hypothetical protein